MVLEYQCKKCGAKLGTGNYTSKPCYRCKGEMELIHKAGTRSFYDCSDRASMRNLDEENLDTEPAPKKVSADPEEVSINGRVKSRRKRRKREVAA